MSVCVCNSSSLAIHLKSLLKPPLLYIPYCTINLKHFSYCWVPDLENQEWWVKKLFDGMPTPLVQSRNVARTQECKSAIQVCNSVLMNTPMDM